LLKLNLNQNQEAHVKITLSRPDKIWKKSVGADLVGCMIGFYVFAGNVEMKKENILNHETLKFIPWNEISETLQLDGRQEGYIIMPSTYNPGMKGPFILSVSTDVDFTLKPHN